MHSGDWELRRWELLGLISKADRALPVVTPVGAMAAESNWISTWPVSWFGLFFCYLGAWVLVGFFPFSKDVCDVCEK